MVTDKPGPGTVKWMRRKSMKGWRTSRVWSRLAVVLVVGLAAVGLATILSAGSWWPELRRALTQNPLPVPQGGTVLSESKKGSGSFPDKNSGDSEAASPFSIAWISDTQVYAESYPDTFMAMTSWVEEQQEIHGIQALMHTGDVVNNRKSAKQWANAVEAMGRLHLPYLIAAGNHDVWTPQTDYLYFSRYFGTANDPDTVTWQEGKGQYRLLSAGGMDILLLTLGYGTGTEGIAWADAVLSRYPAHYAVLGFHSYMHESGELTGIGKTLYQELVEPHANVKLVLCGHHHGVGRRNSPLDDDKDGIPDRTVVQLLADYQGEENGGGGFLRLLTFDPAAGVVRVETYSPLLDDPLLDDPAGSFCFSLEQ